MQFDPCRQQPAHRRPNRPSRATLGGRGAALASVLLLAFALAGCGSDDDDFGESPATTGVAPLALPGPHAIACSNVAQDFARVPPGSGAFLGLALAANPSPLFGGTWVPEPPGLFAAVPIGAGGQLALSVPGGGGPLDLFAQLVFLDPAQPLGLGFTNAVRIELLP